MSARRRPAFDPTRLDDIDDILPVHEMPPAPAPSRTFAEPEIPRQTAASAPVPTETPGQQTSPSSATRHPRGQGGRPLTRRTTTRTREDNEQTGRVPVAVRIPRLLYDDVNNDLLAGPERPSYGQLVVWTCEDHTDAVADAVADARPGPGSRRPRGRRLAADTVQVTLRLTVGERALLDEIIDQVRAEQPGIITRTEVAVAALKLALINTPG